MPRDALPPAMVKTETSLTNASIPDPKDSVPAVQATSQEGASEAGLETKPRAKRSRSACARRAKPMGARAIAKMAPEKVFESLCTQLCGTRGVSDLEESDESVQSGRAQAVEPVEPVTAAAPVTTVATSESNPKDTQDHQQATASATLPTNRSLLSAEEMAHFNAWFDESMAERAALRGEALDMTDRPAWEVSEVRDAPDPEGTAPPDGLFWLSGEMSGAPSTSTPKGWRKQFSRLRAWASARPLLSSFIASAAMISLALLLPSLFGADEGVQKASSASMGPASTTISAELETRLKQLQMENIVLHRLAVSTADIALIMGERLEEAGFKGLDEGMAQAIASLKSMPKPELNAQLKQEMAAALGQQSTAASPKVSAPARANPRPTSGWGRRPAASAAHPAPAADAKQDMKADPAAPSPSTSAQDGA